MELLNHGIESRGAALNGSGCRYARAFILNMAIPKTIEQVYNRGMIDDPFEHGRFDIEGILCGTPCLGWTAPKWAQPGDLIFFMLTRTSAYTAKCLLRDWPGEKDGYATEDANLVEQMVLKAQWLAETYSGKIFAVGMVTSEAERAFPIAEVPHFRSRYFADVEHISLLRNPVDMEGFKSYITVSRTGSLTEVGAAELDQLKSLIIESENSLPAYVLEANAL